MVNIPILSNSAIPFPCLRCDGEGWKLSKDTITIHIPPGIRDGTLFRYPVQSLGIKNLWLTLTIRVEPH